MITRDDITNTLSFLRSHSSREAMRKSIKQHDFKTFYKIFVDLQYNNYFNENSYQEYLIMAAASGNLQCFDFLQAYVGEPTVYSDSLNKAAENGHLDMVQHLAPLVCEYAQEEALCMAVLYNRVDVVHYLLPLCNPKNQSSKFLAAAAAEGHTELFDLLYPLSDPQNALIYLKRKFVHQPASWEKLEQRILHDKLLAVTPQDRFQKRSKI